MTDENLPYDPGAPAPAPPPGPPPAPGGQPEWATQSQAGQGSDGLDPKVGGLLSYLLGWIGGLVMYLTQKNPEVRFHGAQSVLMNIAFVVAYIAVAVVSIILPFGFALLALLYLAGFVLWVILCIKGYNLEHFKLPLIGDMAESWASK